MDVKTGEMGRAFDLLSQVQGKSQGFRGSTMSFGQFCGSQNPVFASGTGMGVEGPVFALELQTPVGSLATDLQIRGQIAVNDAGATVLPAAQQELCILSISDSLFQMGWQEGSTTASMVETIPIV